MSILAPRRFYLNRLDDETGISGNGIVAYGIQFSDGTVAMRWCTEHGPHSTTVFTGIGDVTAIHGHHGKTIVSWIDT